MTRQLWPTRPKPTRLFDFVFAAFIVAGTDVLLGDVVFALKFVAVAGAAAAAASTFGGGGVEVWDIIALLRETWV